MPTTKKELFLTFDDGPVNGPTEFVLEELRKFNAQATFFCIGDNVRKHSDVFEKILHGGHAIGNHTFNHLKGWSTSVDKYLENIEACDSQFAKHKSQITNGTRFFRPPYGRITGRQIKALKERYRIVMWDVLTHDYSKNISRQNCLNGSIGAARPGSIVVFHDSVKAEGNLTHVLPKFLEHFAREGYEFKALT